jgi:hypothetical protein
MDETFSTHGKMRNWSENLNEKDHLEELGVDGNKILKFISKMCGERVKWIHLAQNRVQCRDLVNVVMNFRFRTPLRGIHYFSECVTVRQSTNLI